MSYSHAEAIKTVSFDRAKRLQQIYTQIKTCAENPLCSSDVLFQLNYSEEDFVSNYIDDLQKNGYQVRRDFFEGNGGEHMGRWPPPPRNQLIIRNTWRRK